jgi:hypothetical protein
MRLSTSVLVLPALTLAAACARAPAPASLRHPVAPARHVAQPTIPFEEIRASGVATAFELVETRRPMWLNKRGPQSFMHEGDVVVYLNNARMGYRAALREIAVSQIGGISYLTPSQADYRYGQGHPYGAIVITTEFPVGY